MNDKEQKELDQKLWDAVSDIEPKIGYVQDLICKGANVNYKNIDSDNISVIDLAEMWAWATNNNLREWYSIIETLKKAATECQQ